VRQWNGRSLQAANQAKTKDALDGMTRLDQAVMQNGEGDAVAQMLDPMRYSAPAYRM